MLLSKGNIWQVKIQKQGPTSVLAVASILAACRRTNGGFYYVTFLETAFPPETPKHRASARVHRYLPRVVTSPIPWAFF